MDVLPVIDRLLIPCALLCGFSILIMSRKMLIDGDLDNLSGENDYDFDLFVIGAGSGGVRASRFSAQYGAKVSFIR